MLPLVAILASSAVLGPEVDDGSVVYLLSKPVDRHVVAISKWVVAWATTIVVGAGSLLVAGLVAGGGDRSRSPGSSPQWPPAPPTARSSSPCRPSPATPS